MTDASRGVLPCVTVEVATPALIEKPASPPPTARAYQVVELRPGTYTVTRFAV